MQKPIVCLPLANIDPSIFDRLPAQIGGRRVSVAPTVDDLWYQLDSRPDLVILTADPTPSKELLDRGLKNRDVDLIGWWLGERAPESESCQMKNHPVSRRQLYQALKRNLRPESPEMFDRIKKNYLSWRPSEVDERLERLSGLETVHVPLSAPKLTPQQSKLLRSSSAETHYRFFLDDDDQHLSQVGGVLPAVITGLEEVIAHSRSLHTGPVDAEIDSIIPGLAGREEPQSGGGRSKTHSRKLPPYYIGGFDVLPRRQVARGRSRSRRRITPLPKGVADDQLVEKVVAVRNQEKKNPKLSTEFTSTDEFQQLLAKSPDQLTPEELKKINTNETLKRVYLNIYEAFFTDMAKFESSG